MLPPWTIHGRFATFRTITGWRRSATNRRCFIRPESSDFVLAPGRYAMVIKDLAYDFTVAGESTDPAHCLERTEAANGNFYSECHKP